MRGPPARYNGGGTGKVAPPSPPHPIENRNTFVFVHRPVATPQCADTESSAVATRASTPGSAWQRR